MYSELSDSFKPWYKNKKIWIGIVFLFLIVIALIIFAAIISSDGMPNSNDETPDVGVPVLADAMDIERLMGHLNEFQNIALNNGGSRTAITGYNASVQYVLEQLAQTNYYNITVQYFQFPFFQELNPSIMIQTNPENISYNFLYDFRSLRFGGSGIVKAPLQPVGGACNVSDFSNFTDGNIALIARNGLVDCNILTKVTNAINKGASGVLMYYDPNTSGLFTSGLVDLISIPAFSITYQLGQNLLELYALNQIEGRVLEFYLQANTTAPSTVTMNIIAETPTGNPNSIIVVGSHLDGVLAGPGINDNGSGSSTNLELAIQMSKATFTIENKVRFSWWAAEEYGLIGSTYYVNNLNEVELNNIALNLNFDMLGSPNFFRGVYNGSSNSFGSEQIQLLFSEHFVEANLSYEATPFTGRSDYGPFIEVGIPAGGLATGAEVIKSVKQRSMYGGMANAPFDPCYHLYCDTIENINEQVLIEMAEAAADVLQQLVENPNLDLWLDPSSKERKIQ